MLKKLMVALIAIIAIVAPQAAFADTNPTTQLSKNSAVLSSILSELDKKHEKYVTYAPATGIVTFDVLLYNEATREDQKLYYTDIMNAVVKSGMTAKDKNKLLNFLEDQDGVIGKAVRQLAVDTQADFANAAKLVNPVTQHISKFLGILVILIAMMLSISFAIDLAYLTLPPLRMALDVQASETDKQPMFVSREAVKAARDTDDSMGSGKDYKNYMTLYVQRRGFVVLATVVGIALLISGSIYGIVEFLVDAFTL